MTFRYLINNCTSCIFMIFHFHMPNFSFVFLILMPCFKFVNSKIRFSVLEISLRARGVCVSKFTCVNIKITKIQIRAYFLCQICSFCANFAPLEGKIEMRKIWGVIITGNPFVHRRSSPFFYVHEKMHSRKKETT